jgi:hypothetical protein
MCGKKLRGEVIMLFLAAETLLCKAGFNRSVVRISNKYSATCKGEKPMQGL